MILLELIHQLLLHHPYIFFERHCLQCLVVAPLVHSSSPGPVFLTAFPRDVKQKVSRLDQSAPLLAYSEKRSCAMARNSIKKHVTLHLCTEMYPDLRNKAFYPG